MSFLLLAGSLLGLPFVPEDGGSMFLENIIQLLPDNMALRSLIEYLLNKNLVYCSFLSV
jgi:hypothetical protein